jgi:hypothetical protein
MGTRPVATAATARWIGDDGAVSPPPDFSAGDRPANIIDGAGQWLASELGPPYQWLPRRRLVQPTSGSLTVSFVLQAPSKNRTGQSAIVRVQLVVEDDGAASGDGAQAEEARRRGSSPGSGPKLPSATCSTVKPSDRHIRTT